MTGTLSQEHAWSFSDSEVSRRERSEGSLGDHSWAVL